MVQIHSPLNVWKKKKKEKKKEKKTKKKNDLKE